jgi:hypothetical protein
MMALSCETEEVLTHIDIYIPNVITCKEEEASLFSLSLGEKKKEQLEIN